MVNVSAWLDEKRATLNVESLTPKELVSYWHTERNSMAGVRAADEVLRRVYRGELVLLEGSKK